MNQEDKRVFGVILAIVGVITGTKPVTFFLRYWQTIPRGVQPLRRLRVLYGRLPGTQKLRLIAGIALLIVGIVMFVRNWQKTEYWRTTRKSRVKRVKKKIETLHDPKELLSIMQYAPLREVKNAAEERRSAILREYLESGNDMQAIRDEISDIISYKMDNKKCTDFLAEAAKKYPDIIQEYWPKLENWAHQDSKSHTDQKPGIHVDRTDYYDYFRYPDGRTVANRNGRQRHTDQRSSYSDCHDDSHQDNTVHTDKANTDKIARFKPWRG